MGCCQLGFRTVSSAAPDPNKMNTFTFSQNQEFLSYNVHSGDVRGDGYSPVPTGKIDGNDVRCFQIMRLPASTMVLVQTCHGKDLQWDIVSGVGLYDRMISNLGEGMGESVSMVVHGKTHYPIWTDDVWTPEIQMPNIRG